MRIISLKILCGTILTIIVALAIIIGFYTMPIVYSEEADRNNILLWYNVLLIMLWLSGASIIHIVPDKDYQGTP